MSNITVFGEEYQIEKLSTNGKAQLASLQFLEVRLYQLEIMIAISKTAKTVYLDALRESLQVQIGLSK